MAVPGCDSAHLRVDGGMVVNDWLCQFLADILDRPVERPAVVETTALGAAYLAGLAAGVYGSLDEVAGLAAGAPLRARMAAADRQRLLDGWRAPWQGAQLTGAFSPCNSRPRVACSQTNMIGDGRRAGWRAASSAARRSSTWCAGRASSASRRWRSCFAVTPQTVRRDINALVRAGVLQRHHGGAALASSVENIAYPDRQVLCIEEKRRIARLVGRHIPDHASLFINIGTTTEEIAKALLHPAACG